MKVSENLSTINKSKNNYPHFGVNFVPKGILKRNPQVIDEFNLHNNNPLNHLKDSLNPNVNEPTVVVYSDIPGEFKFYGARLKGEIKYTSKPEQKIHEVLETIQPKIRELRKPIEDCLLEYKKEFEKLNELSPEAQIKTLVARLKKINIIAGRDEIYLNQILNASKAFGIGYLDSLKTAIRFLIEDV